MKKTPLLLVALAAAPWFAADLSAQTVAVSAPTTPKEKLSYAMGMDVGQALKQQSIDVDPQFLGAAIRDVLTGTPPKMTDAQMKEVLTAFSKEMQAKQMAKMADAQKVAQAAAGPNKAKGDAFLADNKAKPGVKALPDGLQYKVLTDGTGPIPKATDTVSVNYRGTLIDGKEFDSSYKRGEPAKFPVNGVIKGWTEALQLMKVGSKWQLYIPSELAYGERGAGADIPPSSTLIFDVELLAIEQQ